MPVFNATASVKRVFQDPGTDHKLPHPQALSWGAITTHAALRGTTGTHCDIVHGDRSYRFNATSTGIITGDHNHHVDQDQTIMIIGKHKETIVQDCRQSYIGPHLVTNHTARNETRMASCSTCYGSWWVNDNVNQNTTLDGQPYSGQGDQWYYADTYYQYARVLNLELDAIKMEIHGGHFEVGLAHGAFKAFHREGAIWHPQSYLNDDKSAVSWDMYNAIYSSVDYNREFAKMFDNSAKDLRTTVKSLSLENAAIESGNEVAVHTLPRIGTFIPPPLPV